MRVFELYFNPNNKDKIFESFHYKPKDVYERKLGQLYMIGEVEEASNTNLSLLKDVFSSAREFYYENYSLSPEKAFKQTLKKLNSFIEEKEYSDKPSIALISSKNFNIYLGKMGEAKILLLSEESTKDFGKDLNPVSGNFFQNMISGKMKKNDKLVVLTSEINLFFSKEKIIKEIAKESLNKKLLEKISALQKEKHPHISGVALIMDNAISLKEKEGKTIFKKRTENFSFKNFFLQYLPSFKKIVPKRISFVKPNIEIKLKPPVKKFKKSPLFLFLLLLVVVFLGSAFVGIENKIRTRRAEKELSLIEEKIETAKTEKNFQLLEEVFWDLERSKEDSSIKEEAEALSASLKKYLSSVFREEKGELSLINEIKKISPSKIASANEKIYLFSDNSNFIVYNIKEKTEGELVLPLQTKASLLESSKNGFVLFSSPDIIIFAENEKLFSQKINVIEKENVFIAISSFLGKPYFLSKDGSIYSYFEKKLSLWIKNEEEKTDNAKSFAIDGSIFVLSNNGKITRYHKGEKKEIISPKIVPSLSTAEKIYTSAGENIFVLDSFNGRIVVLDKKGEVVKQIVNEKIKDVKDISLSYKEKKIYLLLEKKVYSLGF